jgi:hypothetical protein
MSDRMKISIIGICLAAVLGLVLWQLGQTAPDTGPAAEPQVTATATAPEPAGTTATSFGDLILPAGFMELNDVSSRKNRHASVSVGAWRTDALAPEVIAALQAKNPHLDWTSNQNDDVLTLVASLPSEAGTTRTVEVAAVEPEAAGVTLVRAVDTTYLTGAKDSDR